MSSLSIHLNCFGGASVEGAVKELAVVAARLGVWATCTLNGILVMASPDDNPETLWRNYEKARERKAIFVSANVIPHGKADQPQPTEV